MLITPKLKYVEGGFNTDTCRMTCVENSKYYHVHLCVPTDNDSWLIPVAGITLYDSDLLRDARETFDNAKALGNEIARRWNAQASVPDRDEILKRAGDWFTRHQQMDECTPVVKLDKSGLLSLVERLYDEMTKKENK